MNSSCPYCRSELDEQALECPGCGTPHHPECFEENGGCTVFGCSAAPAAEAKISVAGSNWIVRRHRFLRRRRQLLVRAVPLRSGSAATRCWDPSPLRLKCLRLPRLLRIHLRSESPLLRHRFPGGSTGAAPPPMPPQRGVYNPLRPADLYPLPKAKKTRKIRAAGDLPGAVWRAQFLCRLREKGRHATVRYGFDTFTAPS